MHIDSHRIDIITMGCSKNLVDSEQLMRQLEAKGYTAVHNSDNVKGPIVVINTCGFIADAKQESIDMILKLGEARTQGVIDRLIVMGCLSQRHGNELRPMIKEVDAWYGKFDWTEMLKELPDYGDSKRKPRIWERTLTTPSYSAFLKISEGCDRMCAYCAIPLITGRHRSRPLEEILDETRQLVGRGVKEFNIIAQDLSAYGKDTYGHLMLPELIDRMANIPGVQWIRLHYAYPTDFPWGITEVMRKYDNVCKYLDIALQHISTPVLQNMRRGINSDQTYELIHRLRRDVPGIRLRTTLMTGFPGEGEEEFEELLKFVEHVKFDRLGAFAYCEEEDTWAARHLEDTIPQEVKEYRLERLMTLQEEISFDLHQNLNGKTLKVLVEENNDGELIGRTEWDSPEVDPQVIVAASEHTADVKPGNFINVQIKNAEAFELYGNMID